MSDDTRRIIAKKFIEHVKQMDQELKDEDSKEFTESFIDFITLTEHKYGEAEVHLSSCEILKELLSMENSEFFDTMNSIVSVEIIRRRDTTIETTFISHILKTPFQSESHFDEMLRLVNDINHKVMNIRSLDEEKKLQFITYLLSSILYDRHPENNRDFEIMDFSHYDQIFKVFLNYLSNHMELLKEPINENGDALLVHFYFLMSCCERDEDMRNLSEFPSLNYIHQWFLQNSQLPNSYYDTFPSWTVNTPNIDILFDNLLNRGLRYKSIVEFFHEFLRQSSKDSINKFMERIHKCYSNLNNLRFVRTFGAIEATGNFIRNFNSYSEGKIISIKIPPTSNVILEEEKKKEHYMQILEHPIFQYFEHIIQSGIGEYISKEDYGRFTELQIKEFNEIVKDLIKKQNILNRQVLVTFLESYIIPFSDENYLCERIVYIRIGQNNNISVIEDD